MGCYYKSEGFQVRLGRRTTVVVLISGIGFFLTIIAPAVVVTGEIFGQLPQHGWKEGKPGQSVCPS